MRQDHCEKDPRAYLAQILERIVHSNDYTSDGKKAFFANGRTQDAVIRNFEVIGEAASGYRKNIAGNTTLFLGASWRVFVIS